MTPCPTCKQVNRNFFYISWGLVISIILLDVIADTFLMISVTISTAIQFFLIFFLYSQSAISFCQELISIRSQTLFLISMALVRSDHLGQLVNPFNFSFFTLVLLFQFSAIVKSGTGIRR